jgi:hypothetical protein
MRFNVSFFLQKQRKGERVEETEKLITESTDTTEKKITEEKTASELYKLLLVLNEIQSYNGSSILCHKTHV